MRCLGVEGVQLTLLELSSWFVPPPMAPSAPVVPRVDFWGCHGQELHLLDEGVGVGELTSS